MIRLSSFPAATRALLGSILVVLGVADVCPAATLRVPADHSTIGAALGAASFGDEIRVSNSSSPYVESITLVDGVIVRGGFDDTYTEPPDPVGRETIIRLHPDSTGTVVSVGGAGGGLFSGFTVEGGNTFNGGGFFCGDGSTFLILDCVIRDNFASTAGGGAQIATGAQVVFRDCTFEGNVAGLRGGGINVTAGADDVEIAFCTIRACSSAAAGQPTGGGGGVATSSGIRFHENRLEDNVTGRNGGALTVRQDASIRAWGNLFYRKPGPVSRRSDLSRGR